MASPRPSITSARTPTPSSSRRPSLENLNTTSAITSTTSTPARNGSPSLAQRRNRAALRDYYNLKPTAADSGPVRSRSQPPSGSSEATTPTAVSPGGSTELDNPGFDAAAYIAHLLATSSLSAVLKAENSLVGDIRTLDGERKALVYDNYSKLIKAVETIGNMRASMEEKGAPLTMMKTMGPAVGFVAETAGGLIREGEEMRRAREEKQQAMEKQQQDSKSAEKETVRWVLHAPSRLKELVEAERGEEAQKDWEEVRGLLEKWEGVKGVAEVRAACEGVMQRQANSEKQSSEEE